MSEKFPLVDIGTLEDRGAIVAIQDGNHGERHPKVGDYVEVGIPFIMANDVADGFVNLNDCSRISEGQARSLRIGFSAAGDVLLTHKGTLGNVALVTEADPFIMLTPQVTYYRTHNARLLNRFLVYAFREPRFQARMRAVGAQGTRPYIGVTAQRRLQIVFPPHDVQARIADILSAYDDLIENNRRRMALLENAARQLYREWFVRLRFPGHEHTRMTAGVPEGWEAKTLGDLCEEVRETVKPEDLEPDTPYFGLEHMPRRSISLSEWGAAEQVTSSKHRFREGEILFGKIRPYFHKVGVAFLDGVASSDAIVIRPIEPEVRGFVLMTVSSDPFVAVAAQTMREGSKMPRADWKQMQAYPTPLPPDGLLGSFESAIELIVDQLRTLTFANQKLRAARDLLLPRLMSGEIAV